MASEALLSLTIRSSLREHEIGYGQTGGQRCENGDGNHSSRDIAKVRGSSARMRLGHEETLRSVL